MSRGLEARLKKLESRTMSWQARLARMSDEELNAEKDKLLPGFVAGLETSSDEFEREFARTLKGRRSVDLTDYQNYRVLQIAQGRLAKAD